MTEKEFLKKAWKGFTLLDVEMDNVTNIDGGKGSIVECIMLGVDYEEKKFKVVPIPDGYYTEDEVWVHCSKCKPTRPPLTVTKTVSNKPT